jgi:hypothetical protein
VAARGVVRRPAVQQFADLPGGEREHGDSGWRFRSEDREQQRVSLRKKSRMQVAIRSRWDGQRFGHTASLGHFQEARYSRGRKHNHPAPSPGCPGESSRSGAHPADRDRRPSRDSNLFQCRAPRVVVADPLAIGRKEDAAGHPVGASDRNGLQLVDRAHVQLARPISARAIEDEMAAVASYREPLRRIPRERHARRERHGKTRCRATEEVTRRECPHGGTRHH